MAETISGMVSWADTATEKTSQLSQLLAALVSESKVKYTEATVKASSPTLEQAISKAGQSEVAANQKLITEQTKGAKTKATGMEALARVGQIFAQANSIRSDMDTQIQQINGATKDRQFQARAGQRDVQLQLAAFLTPGYYTPYPAGASADQQRSFDRKPVSYGKLKELGALNPTLDGLNTFVAIGAYRGNDRPRLDIRYNNSRWPRDDGLMQQAKQIQAIMIELGPSLVEMGLMEP